MRTSGASSPPSADCRRQGLRRQHGACRPPGRPRNGLASLGYSARFRISHDVGRLDSLWTSAAPGTPSGYLGSPPPPTARRHVLGGAANGATRSRGRRRSSAFGRAVMASSRCCSAFWRCDARPCVGWHRLVMAILQSNPAEPYFKKSSTADHDALAASAL
jgi:hypothetical protein